MRRHSAEGGEVLAGRSTGAHHRRAPCHRADGRVQKLLRTMPVMESDFIGCCSGGRPASRRFPFPFWNSTRTLVTLSLPGASRPPSRCFLDVSAPFLCSCRGDCGPGCPLLPEGRFLVTQSAGGCQHFLGHAMPGALLPSFSWAGYSCRASEHTMQYYTDVFPVANTKCC